MADSEVCPVFYTYAYLREDRTPYYIGKGRGRRAWSNDGRKGAKRPLDPSRILVLKKDLTEGEAFRHEVYMIAVFGRKDLGTGILVNLTDGGEGPSGLVFSEESRRKISEAHKGRTFSEDHKRRIGEGQRGREGGFLGRMHSQEAKRKISEAQRGEKGNNFGKKASAEVRAKMSEARRGERNHKARSFVFTSPSGEEFFVTGRFMTFCREYGISCAMMQHALYRNCSPPPRNGWTVRYAPQSTTPVDSSLEVED